MNNALKISLIFTICFWVSFSSLAQEKLVTGQVISAEDNQGLPGVTILVEGSNKGTTTDMDGNFRIEVDPESTLVFSFVGFTTIRRSVGNRSSFTIEMKPDMKALDEVVVIGYGSVKKSDLTGSVSSVKAEEINAFPALSAVQTLQGRAAGVQIQSNNGGEPGANFNIKIRGGTSINASSDPLFVVDGFVGGEMPPPEDIQSMEILKDASATAIYGSRGANGVVIVTTKGGKAGELKVNINSSYSFQEASNRLDLLNGEQFTEYMNEFIDYEGFGANTDWQDQIYRRGGISNNQLSISGGSEDVRFYVSGTFFDQEGIIIGSQYNRYSLNSNLDIKANESLNFGVNLYYRRSDDVGVRTQEGSGGSGSAGVVGAAHRFGPDLGLFREGRFSTSQVGDEIDNPVTVANELDRERVTDRIQANTFAEIEIFDWLSFKTTFGLGVTSWREGEFTPTTMIRGINTNGLATMEVRKSSSVISENYFSINKEIGAGELQWVNGYSYQTNIIESLEASSQNFISNSGRFWALQQGAETNPSESQLTESTIQSFYSRANYSLLGRYILTFTGRYDGASNFATENKWGFFPSGAVGWSIIDEPFMTAAGFLSQLKLRASYGLTGNQAIGPYQSLANLEPTYSIIPGTNAIIPERISNPLLSWETTSQLDIGLDVGFLEGRVGVTVDYYEKITDDLLFRRELPGYVGKTLQFQNLGKISNTGFEMSINTINTVGELEWSSNLVFARNVNEILELPDSVIFYGESPGHMGLEDDTQLLIPGQSVGVFFGYQYEGIYQTGDEFLPGPGFEQVPGGEKFADLNGDGQLNAEDREIIGNPQPDFIWSINNDLKYKNFDLNIFIQGVHGNDMVNYTLMELETLSGKGNASTLALSRWTPTNPNTTTPRASANRPYRMSSRFIFDGSFIRFRNIALGYNIPSNILSRIKLRSVRVYASAQNLFTITNYPGLDPEVGYENAGGGGDGNTNIGLDYASYPNVRTYTFGLNIGI